MQKINFYLITPFQELIECYFNNSILDKAQKKDKISIHFINPRQFAEDKHKTIDDRPFGGGPGMVYMFEPFYKAIQLAKEQIAKEVQKLPPKQESVTYTVLFKPNAPMLNDNFIRDFAERYKQKIVNFILIIPRYEGIDARIEEFVDFSVSIGPYILTGAELAAAIFIDAFTRFVPDALGNPESVEQETQFKIKNDVLYIKPEAPVYTRPRNITISNKALNVPNVLLSGNHKEITTWQKQFTDRLEKTKYISIEDIKIK